jgi:hypothetical protein
MAQAATAGLARAIVAGIDPIDPGLDRIALLNDARRLDIGGGAGA